MADAAAATEDFARICVGRSSRFTLPTVDFAGTPVGVDVRKVVELGIRPKVTTGILHGHDGSGQVGAGVATAPAECFVAALQELALQEVPRSRRGRSRSSSRRVSVAVGRPTPLDAGLGAREVLSTPGAGEVVAVHRVAAYLRFRSGVMAVTSGLAPSGPLHLRVAVLPALRVGDPARTDGEVLRGPGWSVALDVPTWTGALPAVVDGADHIPPDVDLPAGSPRAWAAAAPA